MSGLRKALAEVLDDVFAGYATPMDGLAQIDALLPEHRDEVRALIGDEQVPSPEDVAELLRTVTFAMSHTLSAVIATVPREHIDNMKRDLDRHLEANRQVKAMLKRLPPKPPMSPERERVIGSLVGAVLDKRFGDGSQEAVDEAVLAAFPGEEP